MGWDLCISNFNCHFAVFIVVVIPSISGQCSLFIPPENARKPKVFWCFEGGKKESIGQKRLICQFLSIDFGKRCIPRECFSIIRKIVLCNQEFSANRVLYFISNFPGTFHAKSFETDLFFGSNSRLLKLIKWAMFLCFILVF